jgi:hypothetical protein
MAFETDCIMLNDYFCILKVFRPVSYTTVLAVLAVPIGHQGAQYTHSRCMNYFSGELDDDGLLPDCATLNALLGVTSEYESGFSRPVDVISSVDLYDTVVIHGNSPAHHEKVFSNILLPGARVNYHGTHSVEYHGIRPGDHHGTRSRAKADDRNVMNVTAVQLLKMSVLPSPPPRFRSGGHAHPSRFVEKENMAIKVWELECIYAPTYHTWHLSLIEGG